MLRVHGYDISFMYDRESGKTAAFVNPVNLTQKAYYGTVVLHHQDRFCKAIGRKKALARALRFLPKEDRAKIWDGLWKLGMAKQ